MSLEELEAVDSVSKKKKLRVSTPSTAHEQLAGHEMHEDPPQNPRREADLNTRQIELRQLADCSTLKKIF